MNKFKMDDKVRIVVGCTYSSIVGKIGTVVEVTRSNWPYKVIVKGSMTRWNLAEQDLELVKDPTELGHTARTFVVYPEGVLGVKVDKAIPGSSDSTTIRTFDSGATRDTAQGKLDYVKALSPIVLRRYVQYLDKHRLQSDGSYRDFDNWKQGMPQKAYISGGGRHFVDTWLLTEGYATEDNHGSVEIEDAICAQLFNLMGRLHEMLKEQIKEDKDYNTAMDHYEKENVPDCTTPAEGEVNIMEKW